jgi:hypothetical protein
MIFIWTALLMIVQILFGSCSTAEANRANIPHVTANTSSEGAAIEKRFPVPDGFDRIPVDPLSFGHFLRNLPLHPQGSVVRYYNGEKKENRNVYAAVVNLPIGKRDLHQCADAVMNLWANYLYSQKKYNDIQFKFLNDAAWHNFAIWSGGIYSKEKFTKYMEQVWSAANTRSLFGQLKSVTITAAKIGDVLIQTGKPYGHAIMIVDECVNIKTGTKMYMLSQSYMPAQETQILINPNDSTNSPWYSFNESTDIITPEWNFTINDIRRF